MSRPLLDELAALIDRMVAADPSSLADADTVLGLNRQLERLRAVNTRVTAAFDASRAWADDGARSAAAWLATRAQLPPATARRRVRVGWVQVGQRYARPPGRGSLAGDSQSSDESGPVGAGARRPRSWSSSSVWMAWLDLPSRFCVRS